MIKIKITPERFAEAVSIIDYLAVSGGNKGAALRLLPRFVLDEAGEYIVNIVLDEDGDIQKLENLQTAFQKMAAITPKRSERLAAEMVEAARKIVNPPSGVGSETPTPTAANPPPNG